MGQIFEVLVFPHVPYKMIYILQFDEEKNRKRFELKKTCDKFLFHQKVKQKDKFMKQKKWGLCE